MLVRCDGGEVASFSLRASALLSIAHSDIAIRVFDNTTSGDTQTSSVTVAVRNLTEVSGLRAHFVFVKASVHGVAREVNQARILGGWASNVRVLASFVKDGSVGSRVARVDCAHVVVVAGI